MNQLDVKKLGLALGIIFAASVFVLGIIAALFTTGTEGVQLIATFYKGYDATIAGSIIGAIWGFVDGFVFGALIAWLYNKLA